jgi:catechol 2,3-dioxygenase-like lactoylglutathione lyase family enzyme
VAGRAILPVAAAVLTIAMWPARAQQGPTPLPAPGFHHLHLNATDPAGAIDFYVRQFPSTSKTTFAGQPALRSPNNVLILFTRVSTPPALQPQTAIWHFGWHVVDVRQNLAAYRSRPDVRLLPLYTGDGDGFVYVSSDTWPGAGGTLGRTREQIAEAKATGVTPAGGAGFAYLQGPDGAIVEYQGNMPAERFNHVHFFHDDPRCATLWYRTHLNAPAGGRGRASAEPITEANCKVPHDYEKGWPALTKDGMTRNLSGGVTFGDVSFNAYVRQDERPLVSTRGHLADHVALSVGDLDAWIAKLRGEGVRFLEQPYRVGDHRAVMIEGPSKEAIELIETR